MAAQSFARPLREPWRYGRTQRPPETRCPAKPGVGSAARRPRAFEFIGALTDALIVLGARLYVVALVSVS